MVIYFRINLIYKNKNMKNLVKKVSIIWATILVATLSVKSIYASWAYDLTSIKATTKKTIELQLNNNINKVLNQSDLEVYKPMTNKASKLEEKKVLLELDNPIEKNSSYSLLSISDLNWSIIFNTDDNFIGKEIKNNDLDSKSEGIKSVLIKDANHIEINFLQNVNWNLEFQLLKSLDIKDVFSISWTDKIKAILKNNMLDNTRYLGTISYIADNNWNKIDISNGVNYFKTEKLADYVEADDSDLKLKKLKEKDLEKQLIESLDKNGKIDSKEKEVLNSASEDPVNKKKTQLEKLALSQKQTPETGAETWILILAALILNTFYFLSRKKKSIIR